MRKLSPARLLLGAIGLGVGILAVLALREATLSTHDEVTARGTEVVLSARTSGGESEHTLPNIVETQLLTCRLEVGADLAGPIEPLDDDGRFRVVLSRGLDETNRVQFRGCVEDWMIDHVLIDVIELNDIN